MEWCHSSALPRAGTGHQTLSIYCRRSVRARLDPEMGRFEAQGIQLSRDLLDSLSGTGSGQLVGQVLEAMLNFTVPGSHFASLVMGHPL